MSRELGKVQLHNGGALEVTSYIGPTDKPNRRRIQFTLTQAEGGLHAYGNTDADGVAELVGILESWLLEGYGNGPVMPSNALSVGAAISAALELVTRVDKELAYGGPDLERPILTQGAEDYLPKAADILRSVLERLEAKPQPARRDDVRLGAAIDGPARVSVLERELIQAREELASLRAREELAASRRNAAAETFATPERLEEFATATPASDHLEEHDVVRGLEDFGALGEEDAFTRALNRRRNGQGPETAPGDAGVYTFGRVEEAAHWARRALEELVKHCGALEHKRPADLTELGPVTHYAARFLEAKLTLGEALDAAARQGGDTLTSR